MNKIVTTMLRLSTACALMAALPLAADAQGISARDVKTYLQRREDGRSVSHFHRFELYYGMTFGSGGVNINDRFRDAGNLNMISGNSRATTFNYRSASGGGAVYFPLSRLGEQSLLALNLGLYAVGNVWDIGNTSLEAGRVTSYDAKDLFFGVPIGVDFIYGGEATLNKGDKVTVRGGLGMMPYVAMGELADGSQDYAKLGVHPYVKAELGFFAGIEWKIRGMVVAGSRTIYDYKTGDYQLRDSDYYYSLNFKIRPTYTVGLVIFPFSFGWDNDKW